MISEISIDEYCGLCTSAEPQLLADIERHSQLSMTHGRMCSGHLQGRLLKMVTCMVRPRLALELGTFTGYSALCIAEGMMECHNADPQGEEPLLITVEANDELEDLIRANLTASPAGKYVELRIAEAEALMSKLTSGTFDMVFIDADKRSYCRYYREAMRLLRPGGFILADNTLWDGKVASPGHADPQTRGVMDFNALVADDPGSEQVMLPLRDGLTLIRKRNHAPAR